MLHVYEFELFEDDGMLLAFPYDMEGGTQGADMREACEMAADWLQAEMEYRAIHGEPIPEATFGNEPRHGGSNVVVAVRAGLDTVPRMLPSEAARALGVTPGRITQMMDSGALECFDDGGRRWVTRHSVEARLEERPKAGRPRKAMA